MTIVGDTSKARFIAAFFDNLIAIGLSFVAIAVVPETLPVTKGIALVGGYLGYFILLEGLWSRTVGKYFQGLIVRRLNGTPAGMKEAIIRSLFRIVEVNPIFFGALPAGIAILSSERKQRIGDSVAETVVVSDKMTWSADDIDQESTKSLSHRTIGGQHVYGINVDQQTRCAHYHTDRDIVAIKFKCCGLWFPCFECHKAVADHEPAVWPENEFDERAILCGGCGHLLTIREYFDYSPLCPVCEAGFNPGCTNHYHLYFDVKPSTTRSASDL